MADQNRITVTIDADLEELIPRYLQTKQKDIETMHAAIDGGDFETIRLVGHSMKGSGGGYGLEEVSRIGKGIEQAAVAQDVGAINKLITELVAYLERLDIVYE